MEDIVHAVYLNAQNLARIAHQGKSYGAFPYTKHLQDVDNILQRFGFANNYTFRAAAWLHDFLEDTNGTRRDIENVCGKDVADLVEAVTDGSGNRRTRRAGLFKRLQGFPRSIPLKLSDRIGNMECSLLMNLNLLDMYLKEQDEFVEAVKLIPCEFDCTGMWEHLGYLRDVGLYALKFRSYSPEVSCPFMSSSRISSPSLST